MIGYFINNLIPLRIGDLIKSLIIHYKTKIKTSYVIGSLLLEKICDIVGLLVIAIIFLLVFYDYNWNILLTDYTLNLFLICLLGIIFIYFINLTIKSKVFIKITNQIKFLQKLIVFINNTLVSLISIKNNDSFYKITIQTFLIWGIHYLITFCVVNAIPNINLTLIQIGLLRIIIFLSALIPSAPGNIGTYHAAAIFLMTNYFYIPKAEALTFSIIMHAVGYLPVIIIGFIYFIKEFEEIFSIYDKHVVK